MTSFETVSLWMQGVSAVAAILVLAFGIYQLRKVVQSIESQTYQNIYELMIGIDKFFIENPKLRFIVYGANADEEPEPPAPDWDAEIDGKSVYAVAEMVVDYFDNVYHQRKVMPAETFDPFSRFMKDAYARSPVLKKFLKKNCEWYPEKFREHLMGTDECDEEN